MLELADMGKCEILLCDYVLMEMCEIFRRKGMNFGLVKELLDTYRNISVIELKDIEEWEVIKAREVILDPKDRPIFIFALREMKKDNRTSFVSGDKGFFTSDVREALSGEVMTTRTILKEIDH